MKLVLRYALILAGLIFAIMLGTGCGGIGDEDMNPTADLSKAQHFFDNLFGPTELGNVQIIPPAAASNKPGSGRGQPVKVLNPVAPDRFATSVAISLRMEYGTAQSTVAGLPSTGNILFGWPFVAQVKWGVGGAYNYIEFDVPAPRSPNLQPPVGQPGENPVADFGNGTILHVTGSAFEVNVRNDARIGFAVDPANTQVGEPNSGLCRAVISPNLGDAPQGPLRRTIYIAGTQANGLNFPLAAAGVVSIPIPPFAKRVRFYRRPAAATAFSFETLSLIANPLREVAVAAGVEGPFEINSDETAIVITNGAAAITEMSAAFDIDPS